MSQSQEEHTEASAGQSADAVVTELPGNRLRQAREGAHLSREEVGHHLRLDPALIRALEEDDYGKLPSPAYICGYLRSYARLLKLDEREIVNAYSKGQEISSALIPENINILPGKKGNYAAFKWLIVLLLIAGLIGVGLWLLEQPDMFDKLNGSTEQTDTVVTPIVPAVTPAQTSAPVPAEIAQAIKDAKEAGPALAEETSVTPQVGEQSANAPVIVKESGGTAQPAAKPLGTGEQTASASRTANLKLIYHDDSWTEVVDRDANRVVYRLVRKGTELLVDAEPPFTILLGNAPAVEVYYRNEPFDHKRFHRNEIAYFRIGS